MTSHHEPVADDPASWVDEHGDALYCYAMQRVRGADTAEELVQETFLAALKARDRFEGRSSDRTWLIAILRRKIVDDYRRRSREKPLADGDQLGTGAGCVEDEFFDRARHWSPVPGRWPKQPDKAAELPELRAALQTCIGTLPEGVAEAFCLRELEGVSGENLCKVLDITPTNMWSRLHRARMLLRRCLETNWLPGIRPGRARDSKS